jgi:hypothetical protein
MGAGSEVSRTLNSSLGFPGLFFHCPWPTSSHRVNPGDSSVDPQGTAIKDLGEAGTHLWRRQVSGKGAWSSRQQDSKAKGHRQILTCTLGVGGSPWQDDLWEGGKESGPR